MSLPAPFETGTGLAAATGIPRAERFHKLDQALPIALACAGRARAPFETMLTGIGPGAELLCEVRNLFPTLRWGQAVDIRFPGAVGPNLHGTVSGMDSGTLSIRPGRMSADFANALSARLVFEAGLSPTIVKNLGLPLRIFRGLEYRRMRTAEEYDQVLRLRRTAYAAAGKVASGSLPGDMRMPSDGDPDCRILCAFHGNRLVASVAVFLPQSEQPMRAETLYPGGRFPIPSPPKARIADVNSLCTHPDYRHGDLLQCIFECIGGIFMASGREWILNVADQSVLPLYSRLGFEILGYPCEYFGRAHQLMRLRRSTAILGTGIGYLHWLQTYGPLLSRVPRGEFGGMGAWAWMWQRLKLAGLPFALRMAAARREARINLNLEEARRAPGGIHG